MKTFYSGAMQTVSPSLVGGSTLPYPATGTAPTPSTALIAVYEAPGSAPRVEQIDPAPVAEFIETIATRVHQLTGEAGGNLPYTVVREVAENLIHAGFAEPVISILDGGATVRFADQGPGIPEKDRAVLPGYTTAHGGMKAYIRGVGSGFPIVRDFLSISGGALAIEDNLGCGSVVTISCRPGSSTSAPRDIDSPLRVGMTVDQSEVTHATGPGPSQPSRPRLTTRQTQVLALVLESGSAGPSLVAGELSVGLSTAYRDLAYLEELGLMEADGGKRTVTQDGLRFLDEIAAR